MLPHVVWRGGVGILEMRDVPYVVVGAAGSCLGYPAHHGIAIAIPVLVLEQRPDTNIFCVPEQDLVVRRSPRNSLSFGVPANSRPEVNPLLHASLFAFVSWRLQNSEHRKKYNKWGVSKNTNIQNKPGSLILLRFWSQP